MEESLPEDKSHSESHEQPPFSYGFPMVSYGFPMVFHPSPNATVPDLSAESTGCFCQDFAADPATQYLGKSMCRRQFLQEIMV